MNELEIQNTKELFEDIQKMFYDYEASQSEKISVLYSLLLDELIDANFYEENIDISQLMFSFMRSYRGFKEEIRKMKDD